MPELIDRGRALPIRAESGQRIGRRTWRDAAMSAYLLMSSSDRASFRAWLDSVKW